MVWFVAITSFIVFLQLLYLGSCRRDMDLGFASQDALLNRFGTMIAEIRKKTDRTHSDTEHLEYKLNKVETELAQIKVLFTQILAQKMEEDEARKANRFSDVS